MDKQLVLTNLRTIEDLCKIAMNHASESAKAEVVGRCSGRTLLDILTEIRTAAHDSRIEVKASLPVSLM